MDKKDIQNLIKDLIEKTMVEVKDIVMTEDSAKNTWFAVEVREPHLFLDNTGEALFALNHLVRRILESKTKDLQNESGKPTGFDILIDINGFHKKRADDVRAVAHMMAERARYFKSNIEIDPMSSFERRIVHEFLAEATDLQTESKGFGPSRRVVIKYIGSV